ncbi:MAG: hypothetical protein AAGB34_06520, partial [Planctomycetota bacterium]
LKIKDGTQLRAIAQALTHFAASNNGSYPLPSLLDANDATVSGPPESKNTTANIMSILVYDNALTPEMYESPMELGNICTYDDYIYDQPGTANDPANALWDPAFRADFTDLSQPGHFSYAHQRPTPNENTRWFNTLNANEIILSTRTPKVSSVDPKTNKHEIADPLSITFGMHGPARYWEGYVAFADNHVEYVTSLADAVQHAPDTSYIDDPAEGDRFLSIFIQSGHSDSDYQPIWD